MSAAAGAQDQTAAARPEDIEAAVADGDPSPADLARPATEADVRRVYLDATSMGYVFNGIGPVTAFVATALVLSDLAVGRWLAMAGDREYVLSSSRRRSGVVPEPEYCQDERVASRLADLVDWSKATALEKLGEGERGLGIAKGWLRAKVDAAATL